MAARPVTSCAKFPYRGQISRRIAQQVRGHIMRRIHPHRTELIQLKRFMVFPIPLLRKKDGPRRIQPHQQRQRRKKRAKARPAPRRKAVYPAPACQTGGKNPSSLTPSGCGYALHTTPFDSAIIPSLQGKVQRRYKLLPACAQGMHRAIETAGNACYTVCIICRSGAGGFAWTAYSSATWCRCARAHPCGSDRWTVIRTGADIKIRCLGCGRIVMLDREAFFKRVKRIVQQADGSEKGVMPE